MANVVQLEEGISVVLDVTPTWWRRAARIGVVAQATEVALRIGFVVEVTASWQNVMVKLRVPSDTSLQGLCEKRDAVLAEIEKIGEAG